jgi:DMSO/TMAO reductase YedYZ molybdopterin-dependent catalytic subunit
MDEAHRLPPGQTRTWKFPLVGEKAPPPEALDLAAWRLTVDGLVERPLALSYAEVLALPQAERTADIHCVTSWSRFDTRFAGTPLAALLELARPQPEARFVRFEAYSPRRHDTSLPLGLALADTWLVHGADGRPLSPEHGFPLRTVTPSRYFYKSLKWLHRVELLAEDRLGYWERESSYHNVGDPWPGDQRFTTGSIDPEALARFRKAGSYAPYRGSRKVIVGAALRGWQPKTRELGALQLKNCDLRQARLAGVDLRRANLSLSDLRGADLSLADLTGADLEGANFAGADLTAADLTGTALSATKFFERRPDGTILGARIDALRREGASGLLEEQEAFLEGRLVP